MRPEKNTVQVCIRLDKETLEDIEFIAESNGIDKTSLIKQAIQSYLDDFDEMNETETIKGYIHLSVTEKDLLKELEWKEVPKDIKEAREHMLNKLKSGGNK